MDVVGNHAIAGPFTLTDLEIAAIEDEFAVEHANAIQLLEHHLYINRACGALDGQVAADPEAVIPSALTPVDSYTPTG